MYHGWTLTSKLDLLEVLKDAIKPYAFYASEYPLILSIENHCSKKQQDKMARHFKSVLGEMLCIETPDISANLLPSPLKLRRKILVKAKRQMTPEDTVAMASEPQLHQLNEASSPLLLEKATTTGSSSTVQTHKQPGISSKSMKLSRKMHPRSASLSLLRTISEKNNNRRKGTSGKIPFHFYQVHKFP